MQLSLVLGVALAVLLGVGLQFGARLFTKDVGVLHLISIGIPVIYSSQQTIFQFHLKANFNFSILLFMYQFVAATQPINALAFVFDGVNFGASDFAYAAYSMVYSL